MRSTLSCTACGTVLGIPRTGMPADGLTCNWCGYVNVAASPSKPESEPAIASVRTSPPPPPTESSPVAAEPAAPLLRWADDLDDNGMPYSLPPEEAKTRPCDDCGKQIDIHAVACVYCGYDAAKKTRAERTYQPIDREWESGWPFRRRFALFLICQVINAATLAASLLGDGSVPVSLFGILFYVVLQAFLLGTYETLRIRRNRKGQTEISITWRFCFISLTPKKLNWKEKEGVASGHYDNTSMIDWFIVICLLPACLLPAVLFWWFVIRADRFYAALARDRGYPDTYLYRGMSEQQARDITQTATDATGLPLVTPL